MQWIKGSSVAVAAAAAQIQSLAQELPYAAIKINKEERKKRRKERRKKEKERKKDEKIAKKKKRRRRRIESLEINPCIFGQLIFNNKNCLIFASSVWERTPIISIFPTEWYFLQGLMYSVRVSA